MTKMPDTSRQKIRKARVLIVEDQPILREKLVELISSQADLISCGHRLGQPDHAGKFLRGRQSGVGVPKRSAARKQTSFSCVVHVSETPYKRAFSINGSPTEKSGQPG